MVILSAKDITKTYGVDTILENVSFHVNEGDRIGIVGANGAGKTTLLNILSGQLAADGGNFFMSQNQVIGYLKQKDNFDRENTVLEEIHKRKFFPGIVRSITRTHLTILISLSLRLHHRFTL